MKKIVFDAKYTFLDAGGISAFFSPLYKRYIKSAPSQDVVLLDSVDRPNFNYGLGKVTEIIKLPMSRLSDRLFSPIKARKVLPKKICFFSPYYDILVPPTIPYAVVVHDLAFFSKYIDYKLKIRVYFLFLLLYHILFAKKIVMISETEKKKLVRVCPFIRRKISIINNHHTISESVRASEQQSLSSNTRSDREGKHICIIYTGGGERRKNISVILRAMLLLLDCDLELQLYVTGSKQAFLDNVDSELFDKCHSMIVFLGRLNDRELHEAYRKADVVVYPTLYEGYGRVVADAIVNGKPVVCLKLDVFLEFFQDYPDYAENNPGSFAKMIKLAAGRGAKEYRPRLVTEDVAYGQFLSVLESIC